MSRTLMYAALSLATVTLVVAVPYKDCGSTLAKITALNIPGCEANVACVLKKNTNVSLSVNFTTNGADIPTAKAIVHGIIAGIPIPFPFDHPDACDNQGLTCPLVANKSMVYSTKLFIKSEYPSVKVVVKWQLQDSNGKNIFCMELPAVINS